DGTVADSQVGLGVDAEETRHEMAERRRGDESEDTGERRREEPQPRSLRRRGALGRGQFGCGHVPGSARTVKVRPAGQLDAAPSPEELVGRSARDDEQAFGALHDQLAGPIFGTVLRVLRSRAIAEEVTQQVMLEIWRKAALSTEEHADTLGVALGTITTRVRDGMIRLRETPGVTR
ncbi:MAG TPA: hypothetical protein VFG15_27985, partial [Amycolatopsis sp.]|nr:hypothetical protein [Amycolatopsis sp.]